MSSETQESKIPFDTLSFSVKAVAAIVGGTVVREAETELHGVAIDSRKVESGNIFIALRGEQSDGHTYIPSAAKNGAHCILAERLAEETSRTLPDTCAVILVPDSLAALGALGKWYKNTFSQKVIAVTGSVGKTTTKQMIAAVIGAAFPTLSTAGNFNSEIGLPLTLMRLTREHRVAVLETGMNHKGELSRLSRICEPDIAVITNIGTAHIENLDSREGIRDAKLELLDGLRAGGTVIWNGDEPLLNEKRAEITAHGFHVISFAKENKDADYLCMNIRMTPADGTFDLLETKTGTVTENLHIPVTGAHNIGNAAAAYLCGKTLGMRDDDIRRGLDAFENTGLRQKITDTEIRGVPCTLIEDCYNASPESMEAALAVLADTAKTKGGRAIAVLGDMLELGAYARTGHLRVGNTAAAKADKIYTFGKEANAIGDGAEIGGLPADSIRRFEDLANPDILADAVCADIRPHDTVLLKASRAVALERVAALLK